MNNSSFVDGGICNSSYFIHTAAAPTTAWIPKQWLQLTAPPATQNVANIVGVMFIMIIFGQYQLICLQTAAGDLSLI